MLTRTTHPYQVPSRHSPSSNRIAGRFIPEPPQSNIWRTEIMAFRKRVVPQRTDYFPFVVGGILVVGAVLFLANLYGA
jgi:hypothetical protein